MATISLRARLLLLILVALLLTGAVAFFFARQTISERFRRYVETEQVEGLARRTHLQEMLPQIVAAYAGRGRDWQAVASLLADFSALTGERILLADAEGTVLLDSAYTLTGRPLPDAPGALAIPVVVDGTSQGGAASASAAQIMVLPPAQSQPSSSQAAYIASIGRSLLIALAAAGAVAGLLALALSRRITGPLEALTAAARRMAQGDLAPRVPVAGNDEIAALGHAFNGMADALQRTERLRRNLVSDVAHELRTPLANVRGYLEAVQDGLMQPTPAVIASLHEETLLLNRLVDDLQELAQAEAGRLALAPHPAALGELLHKAAQATRPLGNGRQISLTVDAPPDLPLVQVDAERIGQVLRNLLGNAYAYTPPRGSIALAAARRNGHVEVAVHNSGEVIPAEHLPLLFERFYRVDPSRSRDTGGAGLGLAIVKQLVEAHGGRVWAESAPDVGTTFRFTLPCQNNS